MSGSANEELIRKTPNVVGGEARIRDTRIAVWMLVECRQMGRTDEEIRTQYVVPLTAEDIAAAWRCYDEHTEEIDECIRKNNEV